LEAERLDVRIHRSLESISTIMPDWQELLTGFPGTTTFATPEWLVPWWRSFAEGQTLLALGLYEASRLVGLGLFSITRRRIAPRIHLKVLRLMGDGSGDSDNLDIPVLAGYEQRVAATLLDYFETASKDWDFAQFNTLPSNSPVGGELARQLKTKRWANVCRQRPASAIPLPPLWETYLSQLTSGERKNLDRYRKRLERRYQARFHKVKLESELPHYLEAMFRLHQERWEIRNQKGSFASPDRRRFYGEISRFFLARGWLELWALDLNQETVAVQFGFRYGDVVFQLQEGFSNKYSSDRVGTLLRAHVLKRLISDGITRYDFLAGNTGYKARWGALVGHYLDLHFARRGTRGSIYLNAVQRARASKEWLRANVPASVWHQIHRINCRLRGIPFNPAVSSVQDNPKGGANPPG
jgi:CelD/BcsL family acetyltransferase involved in cellulose biosynthesis